MKSLGVTRREFLVSGGVLAAGVLVAGSASAKATRQGLAGRKVIYRLSLRGRRGSKAAKVHNANLRFASESAADIGRAHRGDRSRIVPIVVSFDEYDRLFVGRNSDVADLRALGGPVLVGDCNRNGVVAVNELVVGVRIALERSPVEDCLPFDRVADGRVSINELVRGVRNALR